MTMEHAEFDNSNQTEHAEVNVDSFTTGAVSALFPEMEQEVEEEVEAENEAKEKPAAEVKKPEGGTEEEMIEAPQQWTQEMKDNFNALDNKARKIVLEQSKNMERGFHAKSKELARERQKLAAFEGLIEEFTNDKKFAEHILSYKKTEKDNFGMGERPTDPYEAMKYDTALEARKAAAEIVMKKEEEHYRVSQQEAINRTIQEAQSDPEYDNVMNGIFKYIEEQPAKIQSQIAQLLDSDVDAFKSIYIRIRNNLVKSKDSAGKKETNMPQGVGVEKEPEAPILEKSGAGDESATSRRQKQQAAKLEAIKGDYKPYLKNLVKDLGF